VEMVDSIRNFCIDQIRIINAHIRIDGWSLICQDAKFAKVIFPDGSESNLDQSIWKQESPDIASVFGNEFSKSRFRMLIPLPADFSIDFFFKTKIKFDTDQNFLISLISNSEIPNEIRYRKMSTIKLGIGVPTYNRSGILEGTIEKIKSLTKFPCEIFIADDGSSDNTHEIIKKISNIHYGIFENGGISKNKNRILFYLKEVLLCDVIIILEDDTRPLEPGWEIEWILSTLLYGHINYAPDWFKWTGNGNGRWHSPMVCDLLTGQCSSFSRSALSYVGYFDARFGKYGHEHVEHTSRLIRLGYGGLIKDDGSSKSFYLLRDGLEIVDSISNHSADEVDKNASVFRIVHSECSYRSPWKSDDESIIEFRKEIDLIKTN